MEENERPGIVRRKMEENERGGGGEESNLRERG